MASVPEGGKRGSLRHRVSTAQGVTSKVEQDPVMPRSGEEKDHARFLPVSLFQRHPPINGLQVAHVRFGIDPHANPRSVNAHIPCSEIHRPWHGQLQHRHLR